MLKYCVRSKSNVDNKKHSGAPGGAPGKCSCSGTGLSVVVKEGGGDGVRLQASATVYKNGEPIGKFNMASSIPDYPDGMYDNHGTATVNEGLYKIIPCSTEQHPGAFLVLNWDTGNSYDIPCVNGKEKTPGTASDIMIHEADDSWSSEERPWSAGCILIYKNDFADFSKLVSDNMSVDCDGNKYGKLYIER